MTKHTRAALVAIMQGDPELDTATIEAALDVLDGKTAAGIAPAVSTIDRGLTRRQVAEILCCSTHTVTHYAKRGKIRPIALGADGKRARLYSAESVRNFMQANKGAAV